MPARTIAHFDLDSFFVSVEILADPSLKGKPVIVGGKERGVVAACSYEARKFGIHSAMPSVQAAKLCPHAIFLNGNRGAYSKFSRIVTEIIAAQAPKFEKASIDEFYLDLTGMEKYFDPLQWTIGLRQSIMEQTGLPISFGLASSKMMAKMATNSAKPNGFLHIPEGKEVAFLAPLPVDSIPGVGERTAKALHSHQIRTIGDLQEVSIDFLEDLLGKWGEDLWHKARGIHQGEVEPYHEAKSVSSENTFDEDISDRNKLETELVRLTEKVCYELRKEGKMAGCVAIKVRYPDFTTFTRQVAVDYTFAEDEFIPVVKDLLKKHLPVGSRVRLLGVRVSDLTSGSVQANLFMDAERKSGLYKAIDQVKDKFGKTIIKRASGS